MDSMKKLVLGSLLLLGSAAAADGWSAYRKLAKSDVPYGSLPGAPHVTAAAARSACDADPACAGFNSDGELKAHVGCEFGMVQDSNMRTLLPCSPCHLEWCVSRVRVRRLRLLRVPRRRDGFPGRGPHRPLHQERCRAAARVGGRARSWLAALLAAGARHLHVNVPTISHDSRGCGCLCLCCRRLAA